MQNSTLLKPLLSAAILALVFSANATAQPPSSSKPLFSEDFESGALDPTLWTQQVTGDATLKVQSSKVAHGKYALEVSSPTPANKTMAFILAHNIPASLTHHLFGRAYLYITAVPDRHFIFLTAGTPGIPKYRYQEVASSRTYFQLTYVDQIDNGEDYHSGLTVPVNRWFLLEWEFNDQPDQATIWIDGTQVFTTPFSRPKVRPPAPANFPPGPPSGPPPVRPPAPAGPPLPANSEPGPQASDLVGGFTDVTFGFKLWGAAPVPFDIYYDDIALDTHRIGPVKP